MPVNATQFVNECKCFGSPVEDMIDNLMGGLKWHHTREMLAMSMLSDAQEMLDFDGDSEEGRDKIRQQLNRVKYLLSHDMFKGSF